MTQIEMLEVIEDMCNEAGQKRGIKFRWAAKIGSQTGGEWEIREFSNTQGGLTISLTYWKGFQSPIGEQVSLMSDFPPTTKQRNEFVIAVSKKIDAICARVK